MPTIADVRKQYPQYSDMSDQALAEALYNKFYSDMPREEYYRKLGVGQMGVGAQSEASTRPNVLQELPPELRQPPPFAMPAMNMMRLAGQAAEPIVEFIKRKPAEDLPELGGDTETMSSGQTLKLALANIAERDPEKLGEIFVAQIPGAKMRTDKDGAVVVNVKGRDFYINRPGPSTQDVMDLVAMVPYGVITAITGGLGGAVAGTAGRVVATGIGSGALSLGEDVASGAMGSSREPSLAKAATAAALAMIFEGGAAAFNAWRRASKIDGYFDADSKLTPAGERAAKRMGLDPSRLTPEVNKELRPIFLKAQSPEEALRLAEAKGLGVPLTKGQVTQKVRTQAMESAAERGALGEEAANTMGAFKDTQNTALRGATRTVQGRVGGPGITTAGEGMEGVQGALAAGKRSLKGQVAKAYTEAGAKGAALNPVGSDVVGSQVKKAFSESWNARTAPKVAGMVDDLVDMSSKGPINVKDLERWRQQLSQLARSSDPVEAGAAKAMTRQFDDTVMQAADFAMVSGDDTAIEAYRQARSLRYKLFQRYESNKIVSDLIEEGAEGGLKLQPSEAVNKLFGASIANKQGAANAVVKIKSLLGENSPEFRALKEEAFLRILRSQAPDAMEEGARAGLSGAKFATSLDKALRDSPELMKALFSSKDLADLQMLKRVMLSATESVPGAVNFSNTATVTRILDRFGWLGRTARAVVDTAMRPLMRTSNQLSVERAVTRPLPTRPLLEVRPLHETPVSAGRQIGAKLATEEALEEYRRLRKAQ